MASAKSLASRRATFSPRDAASQAVARPVAPPPMTMMSQEVFDCAFWRSGVLGSVMVGSLGFWFG